MNNKKFIFLMLALIAQATFTLSEQKYKDRCSTLSCVYASATLLQKQNTEISPCEDFYEYACGTFKEEQHTPDEKSTVNTLALMEDKLTEYLLTLLLKPSPENELPLHKRAKTLFRSCLDQDMVTQRGKEPLLNMIKATGQWPMLEGNKWNESEFDLKRSILNFREYISKSDEDIFGGSADFNEVNAKDSNFGSEDFAKIEKGLKVLIHSIATTLNAPDTPELKQQIDELIEFEKELDLFGRKLAKFKKIHAGKNKTVGYKDVPELREFHKLSTYLDFVEPFVLADPLKFNEDVPVGLNVQFYDFIKNTPKRTLGNFVHWRIVQSSLQFLDKDLRNIVLTYEKDALGKEDNEQRWIHCANVVKFRIPVAIGSLYISQYFTKEDKENAEKLVLFILEEYRKTINSSEWMDDATKKTALLTTQRMGLFIGYHDNLRSHEAETFYDNLAAFNEDNFLEMGMAYAVFSADREYKLLFDKKLRIKKDWTKYSKPATVNAFYSPKDNTIQFPAAILQTPNFDKDRPPYLNFGAIGSIIGHEMTHAFDDQALKAQSWSPESNDAYEKKVKCIIDQYSSYRVKEVEDYYADENITEFHLDGNFTKKEDIADCGGVKLAFKAFKEYAKKYPETKVIPIGLHEFDQDKLFFLSYAQTYCSVERPERMKNKVETDNHSLDRFRVIGTLSNMQEFADAWGCPVGSPMNPENKCAVW